MKLMMALLCFYCANRCRMFRESYWFSVKFVFDLGGRMRNGSGEQASHVTGGHHVAAAAPAYNHLIPAHLRHTHSPPAIYRRSHVATSHLAQLCWAARTGSRQPLHRCPPSPHRTLMEGHRMHEPMVS